MNGWEALTSILGGLAVFVFMMASMFFLFWDEHFSRLFRQWMEHRERLARIKADKKEKAQ